MYVLNVSNKKKHRQRHRCPRALEEDDTASMRLLRRPGIVPFLNGTATSSSGRGHSSKDLASGQVQCTTGGLRSGQRSAGLRGLAHLRQPVRLPVDRRPQYHLHDPGPGRQRGSPTRRLQGRRVHRQPGAALLLSFCNDELFWRGSAGCCLILRI